MKTKYVASLLIATLVFSACGNRQPKTPQQQRDQLIEAVDQYGVDTLQAQPQDTLFSSEVGSVLRHYPELYHAAKKVRKAFDNWTLQTRQTGVGGQTAVMDISPILDEALLGDTDAAEAPASWPDLSAIDSLYLQLLANEPDVDRKSAIGHTRRAWLNYIDQLRQLLPTLPEKCRPAYLTIISRQASTFQTSLPTNHATQ